MPNNWVHCKDSKKKYGYDFKEIHEWMDEPSAIADKEHRYFRHNKYKTPKKAEQLFRDRVPEEYRMYIRNAVLDHIKLDNVKKNIREINKLTSTKNLFKIALWIFLLVISGIGWLSGVFDGFELFALISFLFFITSLIIVIMWFGKYYYLKRKTDLER